jgi:hypothetical protein
MLEVPPILFKMLQHDPHYVSKYPASSSHDAS